MSKYYDKDKLKESLEVEQIYDLLDLWGGEPEYIDGGLVSQTICHNPAGFGSRKLYYYTNTKLFHCYSGCATPTFDIFDLTIKVKKIQEEQDIELYDAMCFVAAYFGIAGEEQCSEKREELADREIFQRYNYSIAPPQEKVILPEYNPIILTRFSYPRILPWEEEGIKSSIYRSNLIGFYGGNQQITIPHFDIDGRLIGIRGRFIEADKAERYGKYRPLSIGRTLYNHPLSMNLYNLNNSKENIQRSGVAIIFESEKACLMYQSYYGHENDISVACCGSSVSRYHIYLLQSFGAREIILAFDRQFQDIGDEEFQKLKNKLVFLYKRYGKIVNISAIFDKKMITAYKAAPIDEGPDKFELLLRERIIPI